MLRSLFSRVRQKYAPRSLVLMYHRIINYDTDPWDLAVSPENFEEQLQVLKNYNVVPISTLESWLTKENQIPKKTVAITFDDGYIDNYTNAKPLLESYQMPAVFFIATEAIEKQQEYWWDALERICLQTNPLPEQLILDHPEEISWKIKSADQAEFDSLDPLTLYFRLCELVRKMPSKAQEVFIASLKTWASNTEDRADFLTMQKKELLDLNSNPLFTLGAHTVTHPFLPNFSYDYQKNELTESVKFLEDLIKDKVKYLAYPHGGNNELTLDILSKLDLKLAFTTYQACFYGHSHPHTIPRFQVKNWDGKTFASKLKNWMN